MQRVARELNLSETVFVFPAEQGGTARIRIFTPLQELPFAGHPTLGTAFVLGLPLQRGVIELETGVGTVPVVLERDDRGGIAFGRMTQPVRGSRTSTPGRCSPRSVSARSPCSPSSGTTTGRSTRSSGSLRSTPLRRSPPTTPRSSSSAEAGSPSSPGRGRAGPPGCSRRRTACRRTRPPGRWPGRSHATSAGTGSSRGAPRSSSRRVAPSAAPRRSTRARRGAAASSTPSRSVGRR